MEEIDRGNTCASTLCCVCKKETSGAHKCSVCKRAAHAICGDCPEEEEGYGATIVCFNCKVKESDIGKITILNEHAERKRKAQTGIDQWWKRPKAPKVEKKKDGSSKQTSLICVTCYSNGEMPDVYKLCRDNKSSKQRHIQRRHEGKGIPVMKAIDDKDETVSKARDFIKKWETLAPEGKAALKAEKAKDESGLKSSDKKKSSQSMSNVLPKRKIFDHVTMPRSTLFSPNAPNESKHCSGENALHSKIDMLISEFKKFNLQSKCGKGIQNMQTPLAAIDAKCAHEVSEMLLKWPSIKNIIDLVDCCRHISFFPGDVTKGVLSVVRCETCYRYLDQKKSGVGNTNPEAVAKKGLGGQHGTLSSGLIISAEKTVNLLEGGCQDFYNLKTTVKTHIMLGGGQLHYEALKYDQDNKKRMARAQAVTENLIRIGLNVIKVKAAALHFETLVASHQWTGSDVGEFAHGRKQFVAILRCANVWINRETAKYLSTPLPSTNLPPHFYVSCDKSTPIRTTNHAIMLCLIVQGKRCAVPVNAPEVYTNADTGEVGHASGAVAKELAKGVYQELKDAYPSVPKEVINASYQGTVCDGAYQATEFEGTLKELCEQKTSGDFFVVLWDPAHCVDLALKDVFEGKKGTSKAFFDRLVHRSSIIHRIFQRGKMLSHAAEMAKNDSDLVLRLTSRSCATRFSASQYAEFRKLIDSLPVFIQTFRAFKYNEIKEFEIAGNDFVLDLCAVCDILKPYIEFSVALQGLSVPCWKVNIWWKRLLKHMKEIEENFSFNNISPYFSLLNENKNEIMGGMFKKTKLVKGWRIVSSETRRVGNKLETIDNWEAREPQDVENDLKVFMADLRLSFESRVANACKPLVNILTCFDLDTIIGLACGERLTHGSIKLTAGEGPLAAYGVENFTLFYEYVCSLPHIIRLSNEDGFEESLFEPALAHTVFYKFKTALKQYLWREEGEHIVSWFNLPSNDLCGCLEKLEIATDLHAREVTGFFFKTVYRLNVKNLTKPLFACLNEEAVLKSIFTDSNLYEAIGWEGCTCLDIALAKGGTEAIVESYYSVMSSQMKSGGQHNDTLSLRTKIDWSLPLGQKADRAVREIAKIYLDGDKQAKLSKHSFPILGDRAKYKREGKVMSRLQHEDGRLSFLV